MSKPSSGHFHGANGKGGGTSNQTVDSLTNKFPPNDSQIKHIFRPKEGHLSDTPENRKLIENVANAPANYKGKDKYGNEWYSRNESDSSQVWVITRNGIIQNADMFGQTTALLIWQFKQTSINQWTSKILAMKSTKLLLITR